MGNESSSSWGWALIGIVIVIFAIYNSRGVVLLIPIFFLFIYLLFRVYVYFSSEDRAERKNERKAKQRVMQEEKTKQQKFRELELYLEKEAKINLYRQLRKDIEAMPQYQQWRQSVLQKYDTKCVVCGSTENIEVDHRYESFYSIIQRHRITNVIDAYECSALWDINNGAPLCKLHHDQTRSSMRHNQNYS